MSRCSYQPRAFYNEAEVPQKAFYYNEFRKGETYTYDDDCLFLNIWIPDTAQADSSLPVLFYIHGGGVSRMMNSKAVTKDRFAFWEQVMTECGCSNVQQLREVDVAVLFEVWQRIKKTSPKYGMIASPCIDGVALTMSALEAAEQGLQKNVPYMMGSTSQDMAPPMIAGMAKDWCIRQAQQNKQPSYCWFFDRQLPGDNNGAITGWEPTAPDQKKRMIWGEKMPHMGKPSQLKLWYTMFTNKAVGE